MAPNTWTQLSGNLVIPNCDIVDVAIYFEGTATGIDVYLDDVRVVPPNNNLVNDGGFETGIAGWDSWNGSTLSASALQKRNGVQSLRATARPNANQFAVYNLTSRVAAGTTYAVSALGVPHRRGERHRAAASKVGCSSWRYVSLAAEQPGRTAQHLDAAAGQPGDSRRLHGDRRGHLPRRYESSDRMSSWTMYR